MMLEVLRCKNCNEVLDKRFLKKFCCWNCKKEYEAQDKHLTPLSRLAYTKGEPRPTFVPTTKGTLEERLNQIEADDKFFGRAKQTFTIQYNDYLSPHTRKRLTDLIALCKAKRKTLSLN